MDTFMHYFRLLIPLTFLIGGIVGLIIAAVGSPKHYEDSKNPGTQRQLQQYGKTKTRIMNAAGALLMLGFGLYLLHAWLFGPIQL